MFFIASKIFAFIISPICWVSTLLVLSLLIKDQKRKRKFFIGALISFLFFSNSFVLDELMRAWETPAVQIKALDTCEVGIVLGGMITYDEELDRIQFNRGCDRLLQSVELYRKGMIKKILFTGGSGSLLYPNHKEGPLAKRFLLLMNIPETDILVESESKNTYENALFVKKMVDENNIKGKFLLITSGFHMKRSLACFNQVGMEVIPYSTDRYSGARKFQFDHLFIPNAGTLLNWDVYLHELVGYVTYYFSGYL